MLFNSVEFIFVFLPFSLALYYFLGRRFNAEIAIFVLVLCSLFFYGWWKVDYLILILTSIVFNYAIGLAISKYQKRKLGSVLLALGVTANLGVLAYFKYADFFIINANAVFGDTFHLQHIVLPLAISFFTFQQIAYLVDTKKNEADEHNFLHYVLFVTFFPQLIAGPIVHHKEMLPQFKQKLTLRELDIAVGITIFAIGLFKKVIIADQMAFYAGVVFDASAAGQPISTQEAWLGSLAYSFQLYFDFSGYSDMAIGVARLFGIRLPLNFNSPYKATNIIDFWRRWHMTLSRFLRDYLYIPLGGGKKGKIRRYTNLLITMLLGGLWHGAGWTFVIWGALHGMFLVINHAFRFVVKKLNMENLTQTRAFVFVSRMITFIAVVVAWVFFRAENTTAAWNIVLAMAGQTSNDSDLMNTLTTNATAANLLGMNHDDFVIMASIILLLFCWYAPNTQEFMRNYRPAYQKIISGSSITWRATPGFAIATAFFTLLTFLGLTGVSEFIYFQF